MSELKYPNDDYLVLCLRLTVELTFLQNRSIHNLYKILFVITDYLYTDKAVIIPTRNLSTGARQNISNMLLSTADLTQSYISILENCSLSYYEYELVCLKYET